MRTQGTIFATITRQTFTLIEMGRVPAGLTRTCEAIVETVMARVFKNRKESHFLSSLRDKLLTRQAPSDIRLNYAPNVGKVVA